MPKTETGVAFVRKVDGATNDDLLRMLAIVTSEIDTRSRNYVEMAAGMKEPAADGLLFVTQAHQLMTNTLFRSGGVFRSQQELAEMVTYGS